MSEDAFIISAEKDGKERRELKAKHPRHLVCGGKADDGEINEAIHHGATRLYAGLGDKYDRIFKAKR